MKRIIFITILAALCGMTAMAQNRPTGTHQSTGGDRGIMKLFNDKPNLAYDKIANEIAVYGNESDYYHVEITSVASQQLIYEGIVDGIYDTIDASIMSSGTYTIALTSVQGHTFRWTFNNGLQDGMQLEFDLFDKANDQLNRSTGTTRTNFERE